MELAKYKACICEGSAETAIIDILLDHNLTLFTREEMLEEEVIRCRSGKNFEERYLRKGFSGKVSVIRILDSRRENFKLSKAWHREKQTEKTETTEVLMETVSVSRAGAETDSAKRDPGKTDSAVVNGEETAPAKAESERYEKPEETSEKKEDSQPSSSESETAKKTDVAAQNPIPETENWKEKIFGSDHGLVQDKQVFITGLSASEKEKLSFRESDFVKAVSSFLSSKRIDAKTVEFLRKMDISADGAQEYLASLPGHEDFYLVVLMYPEYPGKYILSFLDLDGLAGSVKEKKKQESATGTSAVNTPTVEKMSSRRGR